MLGRQLLQFGTTTKHTWEWEIDERNLKIMNLTIFILKLYKNWAKKQQLSQHQICCQNIRHQKFSQDIRSGNIDAHHPLVHIRKVPALWRINYTSIDTLGSSNTKLVSTSVAILVFFKPNLVYFTIVWFSFLRFGLWFISLVYFLLFCLFLVFLKIFYARYQLCSLQWYMSGFGVLKKI